MTQLQEPSSYVPRFFTPANAESYDSVVRYATFGQDKAWKRQIVKSVGSRRLVLELACGTGVLTSMLVSGGMRVTGLDLTFDYLLASKRKKHDIHAALIHATAEHLPYQNSQFDAVVSSYLAKYTDIRTVVEECYRVLRPAGIVVFHDFTHPSGLMMRSLWKTYFRVLGIIGLAIPSWQAAFDDLGSVIAGSIWEREAMKALNEIGFINTTLRYYTRGTAAIVTAEKP